MIKAIRLAKPLSERTDLRNGNMQLGTNIVFIGDLQFGTPISHSPKSTHSSFLPVINYQGFSINPDMDELTSKKNESLTQTLKQKSLMLNTKQMFQCKIQCLNHICSEERYLL